MNNAKFAFKVCPSMPSIQILEPYLSYADKLFMLIYWWDQTESQREQHLSNLIKSHLWKMPY